MSLNLLSSLQISVNTSYTITEKDRKLIKAMLQNSPQSFDQIDSTITEIMKDGKIDIHDIPNIVLLVSKLFEHTISVKNVDLISAVEFVIHVILSLLPIPPEEIIIVDKIVDSSIGLLKTNLNYIEHVFDSTTCCGKTTVKRRN